MRLIKSILLACCLAVVPVGCSTQQTAAYKAYTVTQVTAHEALVFWNSYLGTANPKPSVDTERKVLGLYKKYQSTMALVADAGMVWSAAVNNKEATQSTIDIAMAAFSQAVANGATTQSDFITAVSEITGKKF